MQIFRNRRRVKNASLENDMFRARAFIAMVGVVIAILVLGLWYLRLQVLNYGKYATLSTQNSIRPKPVVPGRGLILDRNGVILAQNIPAFRLDVTPYLAGDVDKWLPEIQKLVTLTPEQVDDFRKAIKGTRGYKVVTLKERLDEEEIARFSVNRWRFPGLEVTPFMQRFYPYGDLFAHVIGYVGRIDEKDKEKLGDEGIALTHVGKSGLERYYENLLRGKVGYDRVETNVDGRPIRTLGRVPAQPGVDLRLSIDINLQQAAINAFGDFDGSAVALDPRTGEILAMVSLPAYNPNSFVNGISNAEYRALNDNPSRPMFNRNVLGGGPPGSTIKPLVALAGLESGQIGLDYKVYSTGEFFIPGQRRGYRDAHRGSGWTDIRKSIWDSVNFFYYKLAYDMGIEKFDRYMRDYGFGQKTGIDMAGENAGVVPSPAYKATKSKEPWFVGETVIAGIGQGYWIATMLQLAQGTAAIANGGHLLRPHLVYQVRSGYSKPWVAPKSPEKRRITSNQAYIDVLKDGMRLTMVQGTGAGLARGAAYPIAGKTGTAQKVSRRGGASMNPHSLPIHLRHQALFVGFAPVNDPRIVVAVNVEHGGYGASTAGPIARKILDAWMLSKPADPAPRMLPNPSDAVAVAKLAEEERLKAEGVRLKAEAAEKAKAEKETKQTGNLKPEKQTGNLKPEKEKPQQQQQQQQKQEQQRKPEQARAEEEVTP